MLISRFSYTRTFEFVEHWRKTYGTDVTWCIGPDLHEEVKSWAHYDAMQLQFHELSEEETIRSSDIRTGRIAPDAAIADFIAQQQLYGFSVSA